MPELRDLLEGAVDRPGTLDLGRLGERVARHQRRRRLAVVGATAVMVVALGVAAVALRGTGGEPGDGTEPVPPVGEGPTITTPSSPPSTATSTTADAADLPACTADDIEVVPTGEGATAQTAIYADISLAAGGEACAIDAGATFTLRDPTTDDVLAVDGNPQQVTMTGTVEATGANVEQGGLVLSGCLPGDGFDDRSEIAIELEVDGLGTYRETAIGSRCVEEGSGAVLSGPRGPGES